MLIRNYIKNYVQKNMKDEYIHKDHIHNEIYAAKEEERVRQERRREEDISHIEKIKDMEKLIEIAAKDAEIRRLHDTIKEHNLHKKGQDVQEVKNKSIAKENFTLSVELKLYMNKLLELIAEMTGKIEILERDAIDKIKMLDNRSE